MPDTHAPSVRASVEQIAAVRPDAEAVAAPGRSPLRYGALLELVDEIGGVLRSHGLGPGSTVAAVLENGPVAATAFLAVGAHAAFAPLNPGYRAAELDFYLADLGADALLLPEGMDSEAVGVAAARGIPVLRAAIDPAAPAGTFRIAGASSPAQPAGAEEVALVLHTSGTTSRPKMVPLRQRNVVASASSIAATLQLGAGDRCLNVMPLFHIHGLMAAVLASIRAGGTVICTPGFYATDFFEWMAETRPTWYTAVPTMHQAILARAGGAAEVISRSPLRFIRSSSAALPPSVMEGLEAAFGAPVIESYGMTEASHQMASNPLPPGTRKPGTVGVAAGPEIAVLDADGRVLPAGAEGELAIRGPGVVDGYAANPEANAAAFTGGWFRTGDLGRIDVDGYVTVTGRIKEIINRGGETISPREIDEVLLTHPGVAQALAFAVPDPVLGEQVAAVVVPGPGEPPTEPELRNFVADRLIGAKVPRVILFGDEIPKGPTGKPQRIGLAERLGLSDLEERAGSAEPGGPGGAPGAPADTGSEAPTEMESVVGGIWKSVLGVDELARHDRFLDLGGDSMLAMRLMSRLRSTLGLEIPMIEFFDRPTVAEQARLLEDLLLAAAGES